VGEHRPPAARPRVGGTGGYEQRVSWQELLAQSRDDFEAGTNFTLAAMPFIYLAAALKRGSSSDIAIELVGVPVFVGLVKLGNEALPHEQGHLDINELHSRRLAEMSLDMLPHGVGGDPKEASADLRRKVEALTSRVSGEAKKEHAQYDAETAHGKREWSAAIQARLERAGIHF
jgi:hypothetical protein